MSKKLKTLIFLIIFAFICVVIAVIVFNPKNTNKNENDLSINEASFEKNSQPSTSEISVEENSISVVNNSNDSQNDSYLHEMLEELRKDNESDHDIDETDYIGDAPDNNFVQQFVGTWYNKDTNDILTITDELKYFSSIGIFPSGSIEIEDNNTVLELSSYSGYDFKLKINNDNKNLTFSYHNKDKNYVYTPITQSRKNIKEISKVESLQELQGTYTNNQTNSSVTIKNNQISIKTNKKNTSYNFELQEGYKLVNGFEFSFKFNENESTSKMPKFSNLYYYKDDNNIYLKIKGLETLTKQK